jgi:hypothetical protein
MRGLEDLGSLQTDGDDMTQDYDLGDILTVTTGRLISERGMKGVYDILNYMTGQSLFTHQLPRASKIAGPDILRQHPQLAAVELGEVNAENWREKLQALVAEYGQTLPITPLPTGAYAPADPIAELVGMMVSR